MKIAVIDDEKKWRTIIHQKISDYFPDEEIFIFASGNEFLANLEAFDIVFLDIEMDGRDGFETAKEYGVIYPKSIIMILTTHSEMVKRGYLVNAFRYLDKINIDEELSEAIPSAKKLLGKNIIIPIPIAGFGEKSFERNEIIYVKKEMRHSVVHTKKGDYSSQLTMADIMELLGEGFYRCHWAYIVNLDMIRKIDRLEVILRDGDAIYLSERKRTELKRLYLNWKYEYANA